MSRIDSNGDYVWSPDCIGICTQSHNQEEVALLKQDNDYYVAWED